MTTLAARTKAVREKRKKKEIDTEALKQRIAKITNNPTLRRKLLNAYKQRGSRRFYVTRATKSVESLDDLDIGILFDMKRLREAMAARDARKSRS